MLRSAMMVGVIALCCAGGAQSAEAQSHGSMGLNQGSFGGRAFLRFESPRFEVFFFRDRFRFRDRFPFGFGLGFIGWPYYPYYASYPYPIAVPPEGPVASAAPPSTPVAELPPCRESGAEGVVILRGKGCTRSKP